MSHPVTERYKMNDNPTNERLDTSNRVKRVFDMLDIIDDGQDFVEVDCDECGACFDVALFDLTDVKALRAELTDLLRSLGVEVVR